jgi:hypothetical protein
MISTAIIVIQLFLFGVAFKANRMYLDLRSPVFRVQGKAIKDFRGKYLSVTVRNLKFSKSYFNWDLENLSSRFKNGSEVAVEYSPRTRKVWKIYSTKDLG